MNILGKEVCSMGKFLIGMGIMLIIIGIIVEIGGKFLPLGNLPGDIHIIGEHGSIYFPVVTCIIISIVLSIIANSFNR